MTASTLAAYPPRLGYVAFFAAAGVLAFELSLMRILLVASWHHFAFLVISIALLGFGASGTALTLFRKFFLRCGEASLCVLMLASAVSMPLCVTVVQWIPVEARITPVLFWRQVALWSLYWAALALPFFGGAASIGLALMLAGKRVAQIYAANLIGSAVGSALITTAMYFVPPAWLPWCAGALPLIGGLALHSGPLRVRLGMLALCVAVAAAVLVADSPHIRMDPYKYGAHVSRLEQQGEAERVAIAYSPRATVEAYRSELFHDLPFLSVGATPPAVALLLLDGHAAGSILDVQTAAGAAVMEHTLMAVPYAFLPSEPRVLLPGERGGANVWLAARHQAEMIHVVQSDPKVVALLRGSMQSYGGVVFDLPSVTIVGAEPRDALEHSSEHYDLIQLVTLESSAAGSGGVGGLAEDHLVTVEGFASAFQRLTDNGLLVATRGIQTPPRDNLKLFATFATALRRVGVAEPARHIVVVRDYLAVCTMVKRTPWTAEEVDRVRQECAERELTPVWFSGIRPDELNHPDQLESPPDEDGDWYHLAIKRLLRPSSAASFIRDWPFDIRPPTDDRPFFSDFCKLKSMGVFKDTFGDLWLTRTELAFLFVIAAIGVTGVVAAALILLPLLVFRFPSHMRGWSPTLAYFAAIGLAYMFLEMTFLSRATRLVGDPVSAAAVTISGFLLFSGLGSLTVGRLNVRMSRAKDAPVARAGANGGSEKDAPAPRSWGQRGRLFHVVVVGLIGVGVVELIIASPLAGVVGSWPFPVRCAATLLAIAPLGFLMGFPMPAGLARLERGAPALTPWAWSVNGFASVLAVPTATAIGLTFGYTVAGAAAMALYTLPLFLFTRLPGGE